MENESDSSSNTGIRLKDKEFRCTICFPTIRGGKIAAEKAGAIFKGLKLFTDHQRNIHSGICYLYIIQLYQIYMFMYVFNKIYIYMFIYRCISFYM